MRPHILATAQAQFPKSANKTVMVSNAWRPYGDVVRPGPEAWNEGWTHIGEPATWALVQQLKDSGYTWLNLHVGGTANGHKDVPIGNLI